MTRPLSLSLDLHRELIVDLFAGGGGMSTAIETALGRAPDIAINHDADAISMHQRNHPAARHYLADVLEVDPREATAGRPVGLLHLSPDCTHHSQAAGGQPRDRATRALSWVAVRWAGTVRPRVLTLENVRQIQQWGPLIAKRDPVTRRVLKRDPAAPRGWSVAEPGERVPVQDQHLIPDPRHAGRTWRHFLRTLGALGYRVEHRILCAADYGAPTTRERLFLAARRDGLPIAWPHPTHARSPSRGLRRWRSAAECIDWTLPCPSIFDRPRPLADATLRRIAAGVQRHVIEAAEPFIVPAGVAFLAQQNGGFNAAPAHDARAPLSTIQTTGSQQQIVVASLATLRRHCAGSSALDPLHTICAGAGHHAAISCTLSPEQVTAGALRVAAFLMTYYGQGGACDPRDPAATITTRDRLALVTVHLHGVPHLVVDIGLRMLQPRELYAAQGFPPDYVIDRGHDGRKFSKSAQVRMVGNSVSPPPAAALVRALVPELAVGRVAA